MAKKNTPYTKRHAYLAYRLGCLPSVLLEGTNIIVGLGMPEGRPWARRYEWAVAEGLEAINALQALRSGQTGPEGDAARQAVTARWQDLKDRYLRPGNAADEAEATFTNEEEALLDFTACAGDDRWRTFSAAVTAFWTSLPKPIRCFAELGAAVGGFITFGPMEPEDGDWDGGG